MKLSVILRRIIFFTVAIVIFFNSCSDIYALGPGAKLPPKVIDFEHLTTKDGLSNPVVMGIVQDEQGF